MDNQLVENRSELQEKIKGDVEVSQVRPWVRYFARYLDITFFAFTVGMLSIFIYPNFLNMDDKVLAITILFLYIPLEALLLATWGTTPGKALLRIKVRNKYGEKLSMPSALARSFAVWFKGLGIGLPPIIMVTLIISYNRLKNDGITSWDRNGEFIVTHEKIGILRTLLLILIFIGLFYIMVIGNLE